MTVFKSVLLFSFFIFQFIANFRYSPSHGGPTQICTDNSQKSMIMPATVMPLRARGIATSEGCLQIGFQVIFIVTHALLYIINGYGTVFFLKARRQSFSSRTVFQGIVEPGMNHEMICMGKNAFC